MTAQIRNLFLACSVIDNRAAATGDVEDCIALCVCSGFSVAGWRRFFGVGAKVLNVG